MQGDAGRCGEIWVVLERLLEDGQGLARLAEAILDQTEAHVHAALVAEGGVG